MKRAVLIALSAGAFALSCGVARERAERERIVEELRAPVAAPVSEEIAAPREEIAAPSEPPVEDFRFSRSGPAKKKMPRKYFSRAYPGPIEEEVPEPRHID